MSTKIYVVKYIRDPRRWEPRNVGLMVVSDESAASRFIGEKPDGGVDRRFVREIVNDTDIYADWVSYFQRSLEGGAESMSEVLRVSDVNYWVAEAGEVLQGTTDPASMIDEYFQSLVRSSETRSADGEPQLKEQVEYLLRQANVESSPHLKRDELVPSTAKRRDGTYVEYKFHYFWENGQKFVGERLSDDSPWARSQLWKFSNLPQGISPVAFVPSGDNADLEAELNEVDRLEQINVSSSDALDRVLAIFNE